MAIFNGQLKANEIFASIYNMILSQRVFSDDIYDTKSTLADMSKVDGGLYGDTKLYYSTDVLRSIEWSGDAEAANLLALHRPQDPECQAITIDQFRMVPLTVDYYLSKRAWGDEGAFSAFTSRMLSWIRDTKKIYDASMFNSFVGTHMAEGGKQIKTISVAAASGSSLQEQEAYNRNTAQTIAVGISDLLVDLEDFSRDYNDYGQLKSYNPKDLRFVWNAEWVNKIKKLDLPTIFHSQDLIDKFGEYTLPARYFGTVNASGGTTAATNLSVRSLIEKDYNTVDPAAAAYDASKHVFPGDLLPPLTHYEANETYTESAQIVCKIYHKDSIPFMTAFETGTEFFNPRSLTETHYLIWGYNNLEHLKNYPFITVQAQEA